MFGGGQSTVFAYQLQWICTIDRKPSWSRSGKYLTVCIEMSVEDLYRIGRRDGMSSQVHGGRQDTLKEWEVPKYGTTAR